MSELRTARLSLRRAEDTDLADLHAILSDPRAMTYWSSPPHEGLEQTRDWLAAMIESSPEVSDDFVIVLGKSVVGKMGAFRLPEIGFLLRPDCWGRGYASEAMRAFLGHVFARPDVPKLIADVDPRNAASIGLLQRHDFVETGRATGTWETHIGLCDSVYLELGSSRHRGSTMPGCSSLSHAGSRSPLDGGACSGAR